MTASRKNLPHHVPRHVRQSEIATGIASRQFLVVKAQVRRAVASRPIGFCLRRLSPVGVTLAARHFSVPTEFHDILENMAIGRLRPKSCLVGPTNQLTHLEIIMLWFRASSSRRDTTRGRKNRLKRSSKAFPGASGLVFVEILEARQLLSVSVSALVGPMTAMGSVANYETLANGILFMKGTQKVIGPATFNGVRLTETQSTTLQVASGVTSTASTFGELTTAGLLLFGSMGTTQILGIEGDETTTYSPRDVELPGKMVPGKHYTEVTTSNEQVKTPGASESGIAITDQSTVLTLEPGKHSVTVPAGKYKSYVINESITTSSAKTTFVNGVPISETDTDPITFTATAYYAPHLGLVEYAVGSVDKTELLSFTP